MKFAKLQTLVAVAAVSAAVVVPTEAGAATPLPGIYTGHTGQGNTIKLKVDRVWEKLIVRGLWVKGSASCDEWGLPPEESAYSGFVFGPRVRQGRFNLQLSFQDIRGHFVTPRRVEGKLNFRADSCETNGVSYHAIRRR
jgi:hypothetical protein